MEMRGVLVLVALRVITLSNRLQLNLIVTNFAKCLSSFSTSSQYKNDYFGLTSHMGATEPCAAQQNLNMFNFSLTVDP
jgi:hypothetical protein